MNIFAAKVAPLTRFIFFYSSARNGWDAWNRGGKHLVVKVCSTCYVDTSCRAGTKLRDVNFDAKDHFLFQNMIHLYNHLHWLLLKPEFEWTIIFLMIFLMSFLLDCCSFWGPGKRVKNEKSHSFEIEALKFFMESMVNKTDPMQFWNWT